jgi:hypothetical protein
MECFPSSKECERQYTEPFVNFLNSTEGTSFRHTACLDRNNRTSPQPEALYTDQSNQRELVIERKSLVWPPDYFLIHRNDHILAEALCKELRKPNDGSPINIEISHCPMMRKKEIQAIASAIASDINENLASVLSGHSIRGNERGLSWICNANPDDRDYDEPEMGLRISTLSAIQAVPLDSLLALLTETLARTKDKLLAFTEARCILLVESYGDLAIAENENLKETFEKINVPEEIDEVWQALEEPISSTENAWVYEKLYGR